MEGVKSKTGSKSTARLKYDQGQFIANTRRSKRSAAFDRLRGGALINNTSIIEEDTDLEEENHGNTGIPVNPAPSKSKSRTPPTQQPKMKDSRLAQLKEWKDRKAVEKKLANAFKKPVFKSGVVHHPLDPKKALPEPTLPASKKLTKANASPMKMQLPRGRGMTTRNMAKANKASAPPTTLAAVPTKKTFVPPKGIVALPLTIPKTPRGMADRKTRIAKFAFDFAAPKLPTTTRPLLMFSKLASMPSPRAATPRRITSILPTTEFATINEEDGPMAGPMQRPLGYVSPFVTVKRGKRGFRVPSVETEPEPVLPPTKQEHDVPYFRNLHGSEVDRLKALCAKWSAVRATLSNISEDVESQFDVTICQAQLLVRSKLEQFRGLISDCEEKKCSPPIHCEDLQGFWDMVYLQVVNIDRNFSRLEELQSNNWQPKVMEVVKAKKVVKKRAAPSAAARSNAGLRAVMLAARKKREEDEKLEAALDKSIQDEEDVRVAEIQAAAAGTSKRRSLIQQVLISTATRKMYNSSPLVVRLSQTFRLSSSLDRDDSVREEPLKSSLKKTGPSDEANTTATDLVPTETRRSSRPKLHFEFEVDDKENTDAVGEFKTPSPKPLWRVSRRQTPFRKVLAETEDDDGINFSTPEKAPRRSLRHTSTPLKANLPDHDKANDSSAADTPRTLRRSSRQTPHKQQMRLRINMARLNSEKTNLLLLYERPMEPSFIPRGDNNVVFDVPPEYLSERYKNSGPDIVSKFGEEATHVAVVKITLPDLSFATGLGRRDPFSLFCPWHRRIASRLIDVFMGMRTVADLTSIALYARDNLCPQLFIYAYSVAILHRPDTRDVPVPPLSEVFPDKFMGKDVFARAREETNVLDESSRIPLEIPRDYTASDLDPEHRVAYFREDLGINLHHWHWHLVYPLDAAVSIVNKDRRGELFYYMHQQMNARYNSERFSNQLGRVVRFVNLREPMPEGYFPKLDSMVSSRVWPPRHRNAYLSDINRETDQIKFDLADIERWRERLYEAIHRGFVTNAQNQQLMLTEMGGIDILGNLIESSILSVNRAYYGDMHNMVHFAIALCHDPDNSFLESFGVIGDPATAMRDPMFYRLHAMVDDIFQEHKATLPRYTVAQLGFQGVSITGVQVNTTSGISNAVPNQIYTYWQQNDVDLTRGMDFTPRGSVFARFTHLQHAAFSYRITVENSGQARQGTVRIFLGPKFDERGLPMLFRDQKGLFIELDKFAVNLTPRTNTIDRRSNQSSVTIPFERTFRDLDVTRPTAGAALAQFNFCGCGWPEHMLVPKGTAEGMPFQLFVMVSDGAGDRVNQAADGACSDAASYCGIRDLLYPDRRSMGFPFDRMPRDGADTLAQFLTPNMRAQDVTIRFTNRTVTPARRAGRQPGAQPQPQRPANRPRQ